MQLVVFVVASAMILAGAIGVVVRRNPVHAALSLVLTLFGVAVHFVALEAHFLAAVQIIVYAGAIVVLFLFVIMLLGVDRAEDLTIEPIPIQRPLAALIGLGLVALLSAAVITARDTIGTFVGAGVDVAGGDPEQAETTTAVGDPDANISQLARNVFGDQVLAFELTSVLLIVAVAGTVMMTRRLRTDPDLRHGGAGRRLERADDGAEGARP